MAKQLDTKQPTQEQPIADIKRNLSGLELVIQRAGRAYKEFTPEGSDSPVPAGVTKEKITLTAKGNSMEITPFQLKLLMKLHKDEEVYTETCLRSKPFEEMLRKSLED